MGTLVVGRVDSASHVEQCDTAPLPELEGFRFTILNLSARRHSHPLRCRSVHWNLASFLTNAATHGHPPCTRHAVVRFWAKRASDPLQRPSTILNESPAFD